MNFTQLVCPNCGAGIIPNNRNNMITCGYCNSTYVLDYNSGHLTKIVNNNMGTSNVEASNVTINNYYSSPNPTPSPTPSPTPNYAPNNYQNYSQPINYNSSAGVSDKSKTVAFLLCLFLGFFGGHYFYVNKIGLGIVYIFTGGLFGFGWFIDIIRILSGSFPDEHGRPITVW
jgi:restriction system protein